MCETKRDGIALRMTRASGGGGRRGKRQGAWGYRKRRLPLQGTCPLVLPALCTARVRPCPRPLLPCRPATLAAARLRLRGGPAVRGGPPGGGTHGGQVGGGAALQVSPLLLLLLLALVLLPAAAGAGRSPSRRAAAAPACPTALHRRSPTPPPLQPAAPVHRHRNNGQAQPVLRKVCDAAAGERLPVLQQILAGQGWVVAARQGSGRPCPSLHHAFVVQATLQPPFFRSPPPPPPTPHPPTHPRSTTPTQIGEILIYLWNLPQHRAAWRALAQRDLKLNVQVCRRSEAAWGVGRSAAWLGGRASTWAHRRRRQSRRCPLCLMLPTHQRLCLFCAGGSSPPANATSYSYFFADLD